MFTILNFKNGFKMMRLSLRYYVKYLIILVDGDFDAPIDTPTSIFF